MHGDFMPVAFNNYFVDSCSNFEISQIREKDGVLKASKDNIFFFAPLFIQYSS